MAGRMRSEVQETLDETGANTVGHFLGSADYCDKRLLYAMGEGSLTYSVPTPAIEALSRAKNVGEGAVVGIVCDVGSGATQIPSGPPRAVGCGAAPPPPLDANGVRGCFVLKTLGFDFGEG